MLKVFIKGKELFNEETFRVIRTKDTTLRLEHSLLSLARWESKWHKPFLGNNEKTELELLDYIRCMTIMQNGDVDPNVYYCLDSDNIQKIKDYMDDQMTATWFNEKNNPKSRQKTVTAELIYYWMISLQIPFECEKWHLNRLLTLIRVCNNENAPKKKMKKSDIYRQNSMLNEQRRKMLNSRG